MKKDYICKYCKEWKTENPFSIGGHTLNCRLNPFEEKRKIRIEKIRKKAIGKTHSKKTRKLLSINKIKFLKENPDKVPYLLNHSSKGDSFPEKLFEKGLMESNILGWTKKYRFGIYEFDFAFIDLKIDIEVDGETHNSKKVQTIDKKRDKNSIENGWIVLRFKASEVRNNLKDCIVKVLEVIKKRSKEFNYDLSNLNKIYNNEDIKNLKLLEKEKLKKEKNLNRLKLIEKRKQLILNPGVDFNKLGWVEKISDLLNISRSQVSRFMKKEMSDFYSKCYKRVSKQIRNLMIFFK